MAYSTDQSYFNSYNRERKNKPQPVADPEQFYTPEIQQAIMAELSRGANEQNAMDQSSISGNAVNSGFGVGNTSREVARRAKADSNALDTIINGTINQAAQIEEMRVSQAQEQKTRTNAAKQTGKDNEQAFRLAREGYDTTSSIFNSNQAVQADMDRSKLLFGGIGGVAGAAGTLFGSRPNPNKPPASSADEQARIFGGFYGPQQ